MQILIPNTSIAIVDLNLILSESKAAKAATKILKKFRKTLKMKLLNLIK
jgi:hypothetical protein